MALELNGTTGVSLIQDGVVVSADLNSALSDTIGKVKAWVNFDGTTNTGGSCDIRASYNVSSVTDHGTGDYSINFTTAMVDAAYSASSLCGLSGGLYSRRYASALSWSTSALRINVFYVDGGTTRYDAPYVTTTIFR